MRKNNFSSESESKRRVATILDVARRAGVSTATVSRALASPQRVAAETRARVVAAIEEIGYTPNATARNLRAQSTKIVLALIPGLSNTFFTPILNAIEETLSAAGYGMIIGDTRNSPEREEHYARLIRAGQVDGILLFTGQLPRDAETTIESGQLPVALVCNEIPGETAYSVFDVANRKSARIAVDHLIEAGHRRIAHISGPKRNVEARERIEGYRDALSAAGIQPDDALIWGGSFRLEAGIDGACRYLDSADRPTAIFAGADEAAIGFIKTIREADVRVPGDVSIVGFDDLDSASLIDPPLTTMHQPRPDLGHAAAADLLQRMVRDAPAIPPTFLRLDCQLIVRGSVRAIAADSGDRGHRMRAQTSQAQGGQALAGGGSAAS